MKISNTQISDAQTCETRFFFAQVRKLRPKQMPTNMQRGLDGHEMFEAAFKKYMEGADFEECSAAVEPIAAKLTAQGNYESLKAYRYVLALVARAFQEEWEIISVEEHQSYPITSEDNYVYTPDLVFRHTQGVKRGSLAMVDWKFAAQPWTENEINVYQQVPKYIRYWNLTYPDLQIKHGYLIFLITSAAQGATGERLYQIRPIPLDRAKLDRIQFENETLVKRTAELRRANGDDQTNYMRTVNTFSCKRCFFAGDLCPISLKGKDIEKHVKVKYEINDYFTTNYGEDN
jgi:hypothetical protein